MSPTKPAPEKKSGHLAVNGVNYYYEVHGSGEPLLLLHGGLMSIDSFGPVLTKLAETRQVIAVDLQGHGRTDLGTRKMSVPDMGDDMSAILYKLGYKQVDAMGYSLGAATAFRLAIQHPNQVRRLVLLSAAFSRDGFYPEMLPLQAQVSSAALPMMKNTPMYQSYVKIAPHPEDFGTLLDRIGELMRTNYDWRDDLEKLSQPTLLVWGDSDMMRPEHMVESYKAIGGGQKDAGWQRENMSKNRLAVLPNATHYDILESPSLVPTVLPFVDGYPAGPTSEAQVATKQ
ncbi:MAG TPA: alpha/beta hydrolase [Kofleriaceae bacterium]|nr:alpha/beta hydrolase [Kofleriaceae bacterium]